MPVAGSLNPPAFTADVTYTREPQTMGEDQPRPGMGVIHAMLVVADQVMGSVN